MSCSSCRFPDSHLHHFYRPDFDRGLDRLRKLTSIQVVEKVVPKFFEENDISVIETKIIPCNNIFHVSAPAKETEEERKARKKEEKERRKQEKREKKVAKKEAKEREEMERFTQRLSFDGDRDSKQGSETASVGGDSFKKEGKKVKNPLKTLKKLGSTLSRSASTKRHSKDGRMGTPAKDDQPKTITPTRPPLPDFHSTSVEDDESVSVDTSTQDSQKNSESHLI